MSILSFHGAGGAAKGNCARFLGAPLKSTQEKMQRRQKAEGEVAFWQKKKEGLKSMECGSLEEIARKLEMFHTYEDEIAAAKASYNREQMFHILDEAMEQGEKNAEAAEKSKPKTPEERKEELVEEALGIQEEKGVLSEVLDEVMEEAVKAAEKVSENAKELAEEAAQALAENRAENLKETAAYEEGQAVMPGQDSVPGQGMMYQKFDMRI